MTVQEAARRLECKPTTVYALCAAGKLGHRRVGVGRGVIRVDESDLHAYILATRVEPGRQGIVPPIIRRAAGQDWRAELDSVCESLGLAKGKERA